MFLATMVPLTLNSASRFWNAVFEDVAEGDLGDAQVAVGVALDAVDAVEVLLLHALDQALGDDGNAVGAAGGEALDDGADEGVDHRLHPDGPGGGTLRG